jgi:hypothetical protein
VDKNFKGGIFKWGTEKVEIRVINDVLKVKFNNDENFTELRGGGNGWAWDYGISIKPWGNDILISKGDTIGENSVLYRRINSEK